MPQFKYACFISYRGGDRQRQNSLIAQIAHTLREDLEEELQFFFEPEMANIFLDDEGLQGGDFLDAKIANALCHSVCMICLWTPIYFSESHPYCSREYKAMEELEELRFQKLQEESETPPNPNSGLIIPIAIRSPQRIPDHIRTKRIYIDFQDLLRVEGGNLQKPETYYQSIPKLAGYIYDRYLELSQLEEPCAGCSNFALPNEQDTVQWIQTVINNPE
jgi:hypothetical protein